MINGSRINSGSSLRFALLIFWFCVFYLYGLFLVSEYQYGDQVGYRLLYKALSQSDISEVFGNSYRYVGSVEPLSILPIWLGAKLGIDKDLYIGFWNAVLLLGIYLLKQRYRLDWWFFILLCTNYYIIVLMTGAERLKFSFILIFYSYIYLHKRWISFALLMLSAFAHFQSVIYLFVYYMYYSSSDMLKFFVTLKLKKYLMVVIFAIPLVCIVLYMLFGEVLESKFAVYFGLKPVSDLVNMLLLYIVVMFACRKRLSYTMAIIPLVIFVLILGGHRLNMIVFMLSMFILIAERREKHPFFILVMLYFSFKTMPFVYNIFYYGNGFHECCK